MPQLRPSLSAVNLRTCGQPAHKPSGLVSLNNTTLATCAPLSTAVSYIVDNLAMTGRRVEFRYLSGKRIGSGANIELEALATWTREVQKVGAAVEERGKQQAMLGNVRAKAQSPSTRATRSRCCWQSTWLESAAARRRSSARWRRDPVGCGCSRSSDWSRIEQWCRGIALAG